MFSVPPGSLLWIFWAVTAIPIIMGLFIGAALFFGSVWFAVAGPVVTVVHTIYAFDKAAQEDSRA